MCGQDKTEHEQVEIESGKWSQTQIYSRNCEKNDWAGDFTRSRTAGLTRMADGTLWSCWDTYSGRHEMICARSVKNGGAGKLEVVRRDNSCWAPDIAAGADNELICAWSSKDDARWNVYTSNRTNTGWSSPMKISTSEGNHLNAKICFGPDKLAALVWTRYLEGRTDIILRFQRDGEWTGQYIVSETGETNLRPDVVINHRGEAYVVWDCYHDNRYDICAALVREDGVEKNWRVTESSAQDFKPAIALDATGLPIIAWIHLDYVTSAKLIENLSKIYAARFDGETWQALTDGEDKEHVAHLGHGVLWENPSLGRKHNGYVGCRRKPILGTDESGRVWLLWERNQDPSVSYENASGLLCGRRWEGTEWSREVVLHKGHLVYTMGSFLPDRRESLCLLTRGEGQTDFLKDLRLINADWPNPEDCEPFEVDENLWSEWQPVSLPVNNNASRNKIIINNEEYNIFWMDLHCHSCLTGGESGEPDELYHFARDRGHLDVFAIADSDTYFGESMPFNPSAWHITQLNAATFNRPSDFVTFSGYEWDKSIDYDTGQTVTDFETAKKCGKVFNHHNVYFLTDDQDIFRCDEELSRSESGFDKCLNGSDAFSSCHHEKWLLADSSKETYVEICSGKGRHIIDNADWIHKWLADGRLFGFAGMGDTHQRCPAFSGSGTGVFAKELTRESIAEAILERRMFATTGARMFIDFRINGAFMGQRVTADNEVRIDFSVRTTEKLIRIDIVRDGEVIKSFKPETNNTKTRYIDVGCTSGQHFYYLAVRQEGETSDLPYNLQVAEGPWGWSSPIFVEKNN